MPNSNEFEIFYKEVLSKPDRPLDRPIEEMRVDFEAWMKNYPAPPEVRFEPFTIGELPAIWAFAPDVNRRRILLFFHGGGFAFGSIESSKNLLGRLSATTNAAVCAIDYRLAPEYPFPAALDDALTAYRWLLHHPYPRSKIVFAGLSAGGGLLLSLFLRLKQEKIAMPAGGICLCPWIDLAMRGESIRTNKGKDIINADLSAWCAEKYAAGKNLSNPLLSPIHGNLEGLPPLFIQTGTRDLLYSEAIELAKTAEKQGVSVTLDVWSNMIHVWQTFAPQFPEAQDALERVGEFVNQLL